MKPFDPRLLQAAPTARAPIAVLAAVGVLQGFATIALAFALSALAVAPWAWPQAASARDLGWLAMSAHVLAFDKGFRLEDRFTWKIVELSKCRP